MTSSRWVCVFLLVIAGAAWYLATVPRSNAGDKPPETSEVPAVPRNLRQTMPERRKPDPVSDASSAQTAAEAAPSATTAHGDLFDLAKAIVHASQDEQACLAGTATAAKPQASAIHRWTDPNGLIHFSDQAPVGLSRYHRRIEVGGLPPIVVHASGYDTNLPDDLSQNAIASAQAIDRIMRESLGVIGEPGLVLNIEFIADADAYAVRSGNPAMSGSAGNYSTLNRTIHIRLQADEEANSLILRHEITHALIHERVGRLPMAINEGLAGYFEHIEVMGNGAQVAIEESKRSLASARIGGDGRDELIDLLAREGPDFYGTGQEQRYLRAFALVAVLMRTAPGRAALGAVLESQREAPCLPVKVEKILDARYPGGLIMLAASWAAWLGDPPKDVQAY